MFSTPSQYTNYKIRGKSRHLHYPYYGLYNLSYCFYIWLRDFISRYLWGIERSGFFNGREKWAKGFENQRV